MYPFNDYESITHRNLNVYRKILLLTKVDLSINCYVVVSLDQLEPADRIIPQLSQPCMLKPTQSWIKMAYFDRLNCLV
jgi:hypothetical protein